MSYIPKYILKRMFPKKTCFNVVKFEGDEFVAINMVNILSPIEVPEGEIDLGGANLPDEVDKYLKISINGIDVPVSSKVLTNDVFIWFDGKKYSWKDIFEDHKAGGVVVPVGETLTLLVRKSVFPEEVQALFEDGKELEISVESSIDNPMKINVKVICNNKGAEWPL